MPLSALRYVEVDHVVPLAKMGALLTSLVMTPPPAQHSPSAAAVVHENEIMLGNGDFMKHLQAIGKPSTFVCPDCAGSLWEMSESRPRRFRCHTGHAYTLRTLQHAQADDTDDALWHAFRGLQEKQLLLEALARDCEPELADEALRLREEASDVARHAESLRRLMEELPPAAE
jgi:two-component system, chemotaxis family, protein-glutamate methylesterase/glutaminase